MSLGNNSTASCRLSPGERWEDFEEREPQVLLRGGGQEGTKKAAEVAGTVGWGEAEDKSGLH